MYATWRVIDFGANSHGVTADSACKAAEMPTDLAILWSIICNPALVLTLKHFKIWSIWFAATRIGGKTPYIQLDRPTDRLEFDLGHSLHSSDGHAFPEYVEY
jgi:hypothetical protein